MNLTPVFTAAAIVALVSFVGLVISYWRQSRVFRYYEEYASDAQALAGKLKAEVFRDGLDLVISGNYGQLPTIIRFSHADNTPGLNVRMRAAATFSMSVVPKGGKTTEGRVLLRTPDDSFDARFATRSDHPTQARMFVAGKAAFAHIQKLCCSTQTFFTINSGGVELSELTIPSAYTGRHIEGHLESMAELAKALQQMPGADEIKITPYQKEQSNAVRVALAVGVVTAILVVIGAVYDRSAKTMGNAGAESALKPPEGVTLADASHIAGLQGYRVAAESDFDPDAAAWARAQTGRSVSGRLDAAFSDADAQEAAYVLIGELGANAAGRRVVIVANNDVKYDAIYPELAVVGKVAHENLAGIQWASKFAPPDGDGLLIVSKREDPHAGAVIYLSRGRVETAVPSNYQNVVIQ